MAPEGSDRSTEASTIQRPPSSEHPVASFLLVVVSGPDVGARFRVDGTQPSRVLVGTSMACEFRLNDPQVSRRHTAIDLDERCLRVVDLGSTNGTYANGVRIGDAF